MGICEEMVHRGNTDNQEDTWLVAVIQDQGTAMDPTQLLDYPYIKGMENGFFFSLGYFYSQVAKDLARRREQQGLLGKGGSLSLSLSALTKRSCSEVGE